MSVATLAEPGPALTTTTTTTRTEPDIEPVTEHTSPDAVLDHLVGPAVAGDTRARERLLAQIHPLVMRYCRGRLGYRDTPIGGAEDVAQEICLAVLKALPGYTPRGRSFYAYVYGIAAHKVTDAVRAIGRDPTTPVPALPEAALIPHDNGPEQHLLASERATRVEELLELLNPQQREVIMLRVLVGLSAEHTAHTVCSTPNAVRVAQHRALNRLRDLIAPHPDDHPCARRPAVVPGYPMPSRP